MGPNGNGNVSKFWGKKDDLHREQAKENNVFPSIWPDAPVYLQDRLATTLRGESRTF